MLLLQGMEPFVAVSDAKTGKLRLKLGRNGLSRKEAGAELRRLEAGRDACWVWRRCEVCWAVCVSTARPRWLLQGISDAIGLAGFRRKLN